MLLTRMPRGDLGFDRKVDAGGSSLCNCCSRNACTATLCQSLGGVQVKDWSLSLLCLRRLVCCWDSRLIGSRQCEEGSSSGCSTPSDVGSSFDRQGELDPCVRVGFGARATFLEPGNASASISERRGASLQQAVGQQVAGSSACPSQRHGGLPHQAEEPQQAVWQDGEGRHWRRAERCRPEEEGEAKGKGKEPSSGKLHGSIDVERGGACCGPLPGDLKSSSGSGAVIVRIPALLNLLPRWATKANCALLGFLQSIVMMSRCSSCTTSPSGAALSMPPSFGELFRSGAHLVPDSSTKWLESLQVAMFNWLSLGRPMSVPLFLRLGISLSARQWSVVKILLRLVVDGTTLKFVEAAGTERFSVIQEGYEVYLYVLSWVVETAHVFVRSFAGLRQEVQVHCRDRLLRQCDQRSGEVVERSDLILNGTGAERPLFPMSGPFDPKSYSVMGCCGLYELPLDRVSLLDEVAASSSVSLLAESAKGMFVSSNVTGGNRGMRVIGSQSDPFVCCVPGHGLLSDEEEVAALKCKFHSFWEVMARTFTFRPCWRSEIRFLQHRLGSLMKLFVLEEMRVANCLPISKCLASANRQLNLGPDWQSRALLHF